MCNVLWYRPQRLIFEATKMYFKWYEGASKLSFKTLNLLMITNTYNNKKKGMSKERNFITNIKSN